MTTRRCRLVAEAALVVAAARVVIGVWPTAVALAGAAMWWGLRAWHHLETPHRPDMVRSPRLAAEDRSRHVAFARALVAVADAYLADCEQEANQP